MRRKRLAREVMRWALMLGGGTLVAGTPCDGKMGLEFRNAATSSIQTGVQTILAGVVDGIFAVIEPDDS